MKTPILAAFCALGIAAGAQASTITDTYTSYFAFGDSLTDDGKFGPDTLAPPSFEGRFSNGLTYAEHIAADFEAVGSFNFNLALGGATAEDDNDNIPFYPVDALPFATLNNQIATFSTITSQFELLGGSLGMNPLISVMFGGNDLLQDLGESATVGADAADAVADGIRAIAALDMRFDSFVVSNLVDLGMIPLFAGTPFEGLATATSAQFNDRLAQNVIDLRNEGLDIIEFDLAGIFDTIIADPGAFGITDTENPCTPSFNAFTPLDNCAFNPLTNEVDITAADTFLFADEVHPTRNVHLAAANEFRSILAPVPLPATLPLLAAVLFGLGFWGRRRTA